jgi:hypothetical protein
VGFGDFEWIFWGFLGIFQNPTDGFQMLPQDFRDF